MAQQKATTSEAVIEAAATVFRQKGYANATLDDIALAAGVSKPTVYRYAKGKQWLMDRIMTTVQSELTDRSQTVWEDGLTAEERLRRWVRANIETAIEYRAFYEVAFLQHGESSPEAREAFNQWGRTVTDNVAQILQATIDEGIFDLEGDLMPYAQLLQGMLASIYRWYQIEGALSPDDLTDRVLLLLTAGSRAKLSPHCRGKG